jgi:hypothetical protein
MTDIVIDHHGDALPNLLIDVILYGQEEVQVKFWKNGVIATKPRNLMPRLIVLKSAKTTRTYKKQPELPMVYQFICMDGSETLVRVVTDTSLNALVKSTEILPGSTLLLEEFCFVQMQSAPGTFRYVILLKKFSWSYPIGGKPGSTTPSPPPTKRTRKEDNMFRLAWRALHKTEREGFVVFTMPVLDQPDIYIWNKMMNAKVTGPVLESGVWLVHPVSRYDWMQMMTPATEEQHVVESSDSENEEDDGNASVRNSMNSNSAFLFSVRLPTFARVH